MKLSLSAKLELMLGLRAKLQNELSRSVRVEVEEYWQRKIMGGIVPTEVLKSGKFDPETHLQEMKRLADFEVSVVNRLFENEWAREEECPICELHYFGVGTGLALKGVTAIANANSHSVIAYETCSVGFENAQTAFQNQGRAVPNTALHADICFACKKRYISPLRATKIIASRVLHILDTQEDWESKAPHLRKMARTAMRIGRLLRFLDALIIHPCKSDNPNAIWGDTNPSTIEEVVYWMEQGLKKPASVKKLEKVDFHGHIYTAVLIRRYEA